MGRAGAVGAGQALMSVTRRTLASGNISWRGEGLLGPAGGGTGGWIDPARGRVAFAALAEEWQASRQHLAVRSQEATRFLLDSYVLPVVGWLQTAAISAADVERVLTAMTMDLRGHLFSEAPWLSMERMTTFPAPRAPPVISPGPSPPPGFGPGPAEPTGIGT